MESRIVFTVFTATFNRAHTLERVYRSLAAQTYRNFEWLIVDDGSSDETSTIVKRWIDESNFSIRYEFQQNSGKHVAFNRGVRLARGDFFLSLDSDDACKSHALETFIRTWEQIPLDIRSKFSAVTALAEDQFGSENGSRFPLDVFDSDPRELLYKYAPSGDKWGFHLTSILKEHPFEQIDGLSYIPESVVWCAIGKRYKTRYINEVLLINYRNEGQGNLTSLNIRSVAQALLVRDMTLLSNDFDLFRLRPTLFFKRAANVTRFALHARRGVVELSRLRGLSAWVLVVFLSPVGIAAWMIDYLKGKA